MCSISPGLFGNQPRSIFRETAYEVRCFIGRNPDSNWQHLREYLEKQKEKNAYLDSNPVIIRLIFTQAVSDLEERPELKTRSAKTLLKLYKRILAIVPEN